jgi:hypothetical protein
MDELDFLLADKQGIYYIGNYKNKKGVTTHGCNPNLRKGSVLFYLATLLPYPSPF